MGSTFLENYEKNLIQKAKEDSEKEFTKKLKEDNIPPEKIIEYTGLSKEIISKI
ncbi:hypothetical protein [uncultured Methanobrevibacter sp.]|uniref:hypothetical protein n=1 Tax=uncultured Methanobrevibacter sp. TaxID=253161 RepID=UPI0025E59132|nr:hypothetical protein [uncultured Methanobrevibacter sp.]